ncbi:MAG TPA: glycosyltransferase family 2 protein [Verrucomicrobiae bacterium]
MATFPKISIITPSFNSIHTIRETIESVRQQGYPHLEHIVVDGGSNDGTLGVLKEYPHLYWISEKDEGHYDAMNKGIRMAAGEIVNILNADDCFRPGALAAVGGAFEEHPEWDGLFGDIVYVDGAGQEIYRREEAVFDYNVIRFSGVCYVIHQTLFVRKAVHDRLGLYRHKDFLNCCDGDFILQLGRAGCRIGHVPALLVNYRYHEHGQSADLRVTKNMAREWKLIREAHGVHFNWLGRCLGTFYRGKRQWQKLTRRGKLDLVSGKRKLRRVMQAQTSFTSNIDVAKLRAGDS